MYSREDLSVRGAVHPDVAKAENEAMTTKRRNAIDLLAKLGLDKLSSGR